MNFINFLANLAVNFVNLNQKIQANSSINFKTKKAQNAAR